MHANKSLKLVVFDLYGTLVKFGVAYHPFRKVLKWAHANGRKPLDSDARYLMTQNEDSEKLFSSMGIVAPKVLLEEFYQDIETELDGLELFDDVIPTLRQLSELGVDLAICSNLAKPYGEIIDRLLSDFTFTRVLSYEVGYIKPEDGIYDAIVNKAGHSKEGILFVGDTFLADVEGPTRYGFSSLHLDRETPTNGNSIQNLGALLSLEKFNYL